MRLSAKRPYYTTFRRRVRRWMVSVTPNVPLEIVKESTRRALNERKHTVDEASWKDVNGYVSVPEFQSGVARRQVSVRYVTGGMRHGLGESIELHPQVWEVEFQRAHNIPKPPTVAADE